MKMSEALEKVNRAYVPGVVAFYDKADPNPWQQAHDNLESLLHLNDEQLISAGLEAFVYRCLELIDSFNKMGTPPKKISIADAFFLGDENRYLETRSRKYKECFKCQSKDDLQIITSPTDELRAVLICKNCKGGNR